jgi:hypothetical protein
VKNLIACTCLLLIACSRELSIQDVSLPVFISPGRADIYYCGDTCRIVIAGCEREGVVQFSADSGKTYTDIGEPARTADDTALLIWCIPESVCAVRPSYEGCCLRYATSDQQVESEKYFKVRRLPLRSSGHSIVLLQPNGGEVYMRGGGIEAVLRVDTSDYRIDAKVLLSIDNGKTWDLITTGKIAIDAPQLSLHLDLPDSLSRSYYDPVQASIVSMMVPVAGDSCILRIEDYDNSSYYDVSDGLFVISR